jgi:small subunit ribosomal protein S17
MAEEETTQNAEETTEAAAAESVPEQTSSSGSRGSRGSGGGPQELLAPKERRARARAARTAKAQPRGPRSAQERHDDRVAERRQKAVERRTGRAKAKAKASATASTSEPMAPRERAPGAPKMRQGIVVSDKADKTITVRIDVARRHRRYEKIVRTSNTLHAHDERNDAHIGDTVIVREARPLSRTKRWRLVEVVERAK